MGAISELAQVRVEEDVGRDPPDIVRIITDDPAQGAQSDLRQLAGSKGLPAFVPEPGTRALHLHVP